MICLVVLIGSGSDFPGFLFENRYNGFHQADYFPAP